MKKSITYLMGGLLLVGVVYSTYFFITTNNKSSIEYQTEKPIKTTIKKMTVVTGKVIPEDEVEIKPQISGIIEDIYIREGDIVRAGDLIARIKVLPSEAALNAAFGRVNNAKIVLENSEVEYNRNKKLFDKGILSAQDFNSVELRYKQSKQELTNANSDLQIIQSGTAGKGTANTNIRATVSGTILEIPIRKGDQVIESNNFNQGTTIAKIADLTNIIFEGQIDEAEVGKLEINMPLKISLGAIDDKKMDATLRFIAPQGIEEQGAVQFKIEASVELDSSFFVRAGYSANAIIVIEEKENVLAIKEALVQFDEDIGGPYVEVETSSQEFKRVEVKLGISDGINVEILSGLTEQDMVKVWNIVEPNKGKIRRKK